MRLFILFFSTLLISQSAYVVVAQPLRIKWNSAPHTGFVFQISNQEAQKLLTKSEPDTIIHSLLHTQIDTFDVRKGWTHTPDQGHFILVKIKENKLHCEYKSVFPYQVLLLNEYNALSLQVLDLEGNVREDAVVKFKTRRIGFDRDSKTYRIENAWFNALRKAVTVELNGFRSVFDIEKNEVPSWSNDYYGHDDGPDFYSYMITDKNKYKPGERIRFKSYALSGSRHPIRRDLEVWLMKKGKPLRMGVVSPHRPGSFAGEIQLHDSLKMILDRDYALQLWEKSGRVVANCRFKYEDYELNGNKLQVVLDTHRQFYPVPNRLTITATNDNGLLLKDARATVTLVTDNIREIFQPLVVLPDTLLRRELKLEDAGPTVVEIPSALFQKSNTAYHVHVSVVNSQSQRMEMTVSGLHCFSQYELTASYVHDSIVYKMLNNGILLPDVPVKVYRDGATEGEDRILPYREKINPALSTIRLQGELVSRSFSMAGMLPKLEILGGIKRDSFNISLDNPHRIDVSWYIYRGSELLEKGSGNEIDFRSKIDDRSKTYYVELLYAFGGSDHMVSRDFPFREGSLDIALNLPDRVYPGQRVDATIDVTDEAGTPVGGVDLTAMAATVKLNYNLPDLPYYRSTSSARPDQATYRKHAVNKRMAILDLDYTLWAPRARLDTMKYYQFTYPGKQLFFHQMAIADSTQFAVYVMKGGAAENVYVIEVDRVPVYYSWTGHPKRYSFYVEPEKWKQVTIRLYDRVLILDAMCFDAQKKTIVSLDLDHLPRQVSVHAIAPKIDVMRRRRKRVTWIFTETEVRRHTRYLAAFRGVYQPAYLESGSDFVPICAGGGNWDRFVVGPVMPGMQTYREQKKMETTYAHEGGFSYAFEGNVVYKLEPPKLFPEQLTHLSFNPLVSVDDMVINRKLLLEQAANVTPGWHPQVIDLADYACRVKLLLPHKTAQSGVASVVFEDCKTGVAVFPCRAHKGGVDYFTLPRGWYHVVVLYNNGTYVKMDSVRLQSHYTVVADMHHQPLRAASPVSAEWLASPANHCFETSAVTSRTYSLTQTRDAVGNVHGTIFDDANAPLPGVVVMVKGTTIGTVTDFEGNFVIDVPDPLSILVVSFIGYKVREMEISAGSKMNLSMEPDITELSEVVVVGYGTQAKKDVTGSVMIRGAASISVSDALAGRVAGVTLAGDNDKAEAPEKTSRAAEQQFYQELLTLKSIRSQFSDVGIWEPRLFTDRHGQAKFTVTFPDDITRWNAVVYAMNRHLQTGTARKSIQSYKPLMAELHVPQFLTVGDSACLLGKVLNYTSDKSMQGKTQWGAATVAQDVAFDGYHTEKRCVIATSADTLAANYTFTRDDGYFDGEARKVPVVEQGTIRANGSLSVMKNGDELLLKPESGKVVKLAILATPLDIYAGDVQYLLHYKYDCNEQLASKLMGFLNYRMIARYEGKAFEYDADVNKIIQRLLKNQNSEFLWSWWDVSPGTSYWMSAHIMRALKAAQDAGYAVQLDLENVVRKATYKYDYLHQLSLSDVHVIHALAMWGAQVDYTQYLREIDHQIRRADSVAYVYERRYSRPRYSTLNEKLLLYEIRQLRGLPLVRDSLLRYKKQTVLNEVYFADQRPSYSWYQGDLATNAIAYRIVKRDSTLQHLAVSMQMYFLSLRRKGGWNTYEASNVLYSILPDLIAEGSTKKLPASVSLRGKVNEQLTQFPYKLELAAGEELRVRKDTGLPLYFMQYVEERVVTPQADTDAFKIQTTFSERSLKAGKPVVLKTTIEVKHDAKLEHVMIEIPIPGACSYADKRQYGNSNAIETHREYFKDKTLIFCENMTAGTYVFQVHLLPRFTGTYHVNPAQVSLMYFPVINANTGLEKVKVGE